ncbi:hypothetical protein LUZ63_012006 [Rhynchospora breviuscula]|uniref:HTH TFE/IIEalpha-type domain-containing protein n=1 Tax=Rhynchospora breviuscula TaxID=2022672 RepID=A0A9Q0HRK0_9POAL|nr:hypothetical protein LUZ63_012006 [Rhynchospora breviuscula]
MSLEPFNRLVKLAARAFYDDITMKGDNQPKTGRGDNRGIAVVVLDALARRQWVREEDLAKALKLHSKQLRRILRFFEEEKFVTRDHRKESAKGAKIFSAAVAAATGKGHQTGKEGEEKVKIHTHSYCCLDYAQIYDVVRYRIHKMKKKLKDELDSRNTVQTYVCPNCGKRYSAFDALQLISFTDDVFHCERCDGELVAESDKLAADEMGDGDDSRSRRREKLKDLLKRIEEQLNPLTIQLNRVKDLPVPDFGTLQQWEARASAAARGYGEIDPNDANKSSQVPGYGGTPMPSLGDTKVEVDLGGGVKEEAQPEGKTVKAKVLPPWMIKEGMVLSKEQRGETSVEADATQETTIDDKKQTDMMDDKSLKDEYYKAYYDAYHAKLQEVEAIKQEVRVSASDDLFGTTESSSHRQVGMKSKRGDDDNDDVEWEGDQPTVDTGNAGTSYKLAADLNMEAKESEEEEDDDIDWEEG